jgi:hypothetical protein
MHRGARLYHFATIRETNTPMNVLYVVAAALLVVLVIAHSFLGERLIFPAVFALPDLPPLLGSRSFMRQTLRFTWHTTSVLGVILASTLVSLAIAPKSAASDQIATTISTGLFVCGLLSGIVARGRHFSWAVFLACSALVWFGI